jgi:hypothetical protein
MKISILTGILILTCALNISAQVMNYEIDPEFNSGNLLNRGGVSSTLIHTDGSVLVNGNFQNWDSPAGSFCLLNADGSLNVSLSSENSSFKLSFYLQGYLGYGGSGGINYFNLPGAFDTDFYFEFFKSVYNGPLSNYVRDAYIDENNYILAAGRFFTDSTLMDTNIASQGLRQLCMIDSTGAPVPGFPMIRCAQPVNSEIYSIKKLSSGKFIISGFFQEVEGHQTNSIARLHADYSVDTSFVSPLQSNVYSIVQHIDSQDRIWIFLEYGTLTTNPDSQVLHARLLSDGSVDETFQSPVIKLEIGGELYDSSFSRIFEDSDDTFIMVGQFSHYNDTVRRGVLKIYDNGYIVPEVFENFGADEAVWVGWIASFGAHISSITPLQDGKLLLGGQFSSFGGEPYSCLVRLQPSGYVGTKNVIPKSELKFYPNPTSDHFRLEISNENLSSVHLKLYDLTGRLSDSNDNYRVGSAFQINHLSPGIYVVRAESEGQIFSGKLIVY